MSESFISYIVLNRVVEEGMQNKKILNKLFQDFGIDLRNNIVLSTARKLTDDQLLEKLKNFGIVLNKDKLRELIKNFLSAEDMSRWMIKEYQPKLDTSKDEDWIWFCLTILWERWYPDLPNFEMIDDKMQEGYKKLSYNLKAGVDSWLVTWEDIFSIIKQNNFKTISKFDKKFRGTQFVHDWIYDLLMELWNAGLDDKQYHEKRIKFCEEFMAYFIKEADLEDDIKSSLADSYFYIGKREKADELYKNWLDINPVWGWGWIHWSDCYNLRSNKNKPDLNRAEKILIEGLSVRNVKDKEDILERLEDLYRDQNRVKEANKIKKDLIKLPNIENTEERYQGKKISRNDPCLCGSGKKYKKCCGR